MPRRLPRHPAERSPWAEPEQRRDPRERFADLAFLSQDSAETVAASAAHYTNSAVYAFGGDREEARNALLALRRRLIDAYDRAARAALRKHDEWDYS
jgi:hypothetical protein